MKRPLFSWDLSLFDIYIQNQFLKTPQGNVIQVPTLELAKAIEEEWDKDPSPHYQRKPLTSLVASALDRVAVSRESYTNFIVESVTQDAVLFWEENSPEVLQKQDRKWKPIIEKVNHDLGLVLKSTLTFFINTLSSSEKLKVEGFLEALTDFKLVGFSHLLTLSNSFCLSYLIIKQNLEPAIAWDLAQLHEHTHHHLWGEDTETLTHEWAQREEFLQTAKFLNLIG